MPREVQGDDGPRVVHLEGRPRVAVRVGLEVEVVSLEVQDARARLGDALDAVEEVLALELDDARRDDVGRRFPEQ